MNDSPDPGSRTSGSVGDQPPLVAPSERPNACPECGRPLTEPLMEQPRFCPSCGRRLWGEVTARVSRMEGYAIASIVCAVAGLFAFPVVGPILGIVFGKRAEKNIAADPTLEGAGLAQAGVIVGWVGLIVSLVVIALILAVFAPVFTSTSSGMESRLIDPATWAAR